ncbi:type I-D CRISPR-associated protein Cas10d/Csc3 [Methylacidiphilum caldifontis]|uniref:type I-D CRISPR-associated protein Cas10d/Csc3 n=1 Tax=Methylacidiphilum caldifontis TaxID=2795386 RepID=UPI001A8FC68F|nr:type I-D CRISPR-associated protein Cas10d/Csc3 [Methylacidiphilum caldifontis]QSR87925.1 type I-D CRISPR-associated protein Cas10d/Csc3 [Methylacidiphilum caldifontis]
MATLLDKKLSNTIIDNYIEHVVKDGLKSLQDHKQYGIREGTTLADHLINGAFTIYTLKNAIGLSDIETMLLMSTFSIHDLNKLSNDPEASLSKLVDNQDFVKENIFKMAVDKFFKEWEEYYNDIISLIRAHSGHFHLSGDQLIPAKDKTKLGLIRIKALSHIMKAVDIIDLSKEFNERRKKEEFLHHINSASKIQYRWISHKLTEHRGVLSNIIHNQIIDVFQSYKAIPLLVYAEGTWYMLPNSVDLPSRENLIEEISQKFDSKLSKLRIEDLSKVINMTKDGIKIDESIIDLLPADEILKEVDTLIYKRNFKIQDQIEKAKEKAQKNGIDFDEYIKKNGLRVFTTRDDMVKGEFLRTTYLFINAHFSKEIKSWFNIDDAWKLICNRLGIEENVFEVFDKLYDRSFVIGANVSLNIEELKEKLTRLWNEILIKRNSSSRELKDNIFKSYMEKSIVFDLGQDQSKVSFESFLISYVTQNHKQDCYGSFEGNTDKWMAPQVPNGILVQQFSNRLPAGASIEPKRYVSEITKEQFFIEKMVFRTGSEKATYLHFMPERFLPYAQLEILKKELIDLVRDEDILLGLDDKSLAERKEKVYFGNKNFGISLPKYSEVIANIISIPVFVKAETTSERTLRALEYGGRLGLEFGLKVIVSESSIPPLSANSFEFLFIDNTNWQVQSFLCGKKVSKEKVKDLIASFDSVRSIENKIRDDWKHSYFYTLITSLAESPLRIFWEIDRTLEKKLRGSKIKNPEWLAINICSQIKEDVERLDSRRNVMGEDKLKLSDYIKELAKIGWDGKIKGETLVRNSLLYPLNEIFDNLRKESSVFDIEAKRASIIQKIFDHLSRIIEWEVGKTKYNHVTNFVNTFLEMYDKLYGNKLSKLLSDEKDIKSAYLFYLRNEINTSKEEKNDSSSSKL